MGAVYDEFERELAAIRNTCADDPRREMIQLFMMALEREELVSVGYRESLMEQRHLCDATGGERQGASSAYARLDMEGRGDAYDLHPAARSSNLVAGVCVRRRF